MADAGIIGCSKTGNSFAHFPARLSSLSNLPGHYRD